MFVCSCSKKIVIGDSTTTEIVVELKDGGTGYSWLEECGARFSEAMKDYSYAPGKTGVNVIVTPVENPSLSASETSGITATVSARTAIRRCAYR